jgi:hypothetical protein
MRDTHPSAILCTGCDASEGVLCLTGRSFPCFERRRGVAQLDELLATVQQPAGFPPDAWALVVQSIVQHQRGPSGLPVGGGVMHVLHAGGGTCAAIEYFQQRLCAPPFAARIAVGRAQLQRFANIFDAIDVWAARASAAHRCADDPDANPQKNPRKNVGAIPPKVSRRSRAFFQEHLANAFDSRPGFSADALMRSVFSSHLRLSDVE